MPLRRVDVRVALRLSRCAQSWPQDLEPEAVARAHRAAPPPSSAAFHMIFFGTQPTFTHVPPSGPDSTSATRAPYSAARCAAASPPLPPPITTKSYCSPIDTSRCPKPMLYGRSPTRRGSRRCGRLQWPPIQRTGMHGKSLTRPGTAAAVRCRFVPSTWSRRCASCCRAKPCADRRARRSAAADLRLGDRAAGGAAAPASRAPGRR